MEEKGKHRMNPRATAQPSLFRCLACAFLLSMPTLPALRAEETADTASLKRFTDFKQAVAHAKPRSLHIFIAAMLEGDAGSERLASALQDTGLYLNAQKTVLYEYRIPDAGRATSFRAHFEIEGEEFPVVILTDPSGKPLAHKTGPVSEDDYYTFVETTLDKSALVLPQRIQLKRQLSAVLQDAKSGREKYRTPMRTWTLITGEEFVAAVVESTGSKVVFEKEDGEYLTVPAMQLGRNDFKYLEEHLKAGQQEGGS